MRRLMLLRHAKTETDAPSGRDIDRRLDDRGRSDAAEIGGWIANLAPDQVMVSTAVRARQTWNIIADVLSAAGVQPEVALLPELYTAGPSQLLESIREAAPTTRCLLVIAHNPGLHELVLGLVGSGDKAAGQALADNLPTGAVALLSFAGDDWADVTFRSGRLEAFVSPKLLKAAQG